MVWAKVLVGRCKDRMGCSVALRRRFGKSPDRARIDRCKSAYCIVSDGVNS